MGWIWIATDPWVGLRNFLGVVSRTKPSFQPRGLFPRASIWSISVHSPHHERQGGCFSCLQPIIDTVQYASDPHVETERRLRSACVATKNAVGMPWGSSRRTSWLRLASATPCCVKTSLSVGVWTNRRRVFSLACHAPIVRRGKPAMHNTAGSNCRPLCWLAVHARVRQKHTRTVCVRAEVTAHAVVTDREFRWCARRYICGVGCAPRGPESRTCTCDVTCACKSSVSCDAAASPTMSQHSVLLWLQHSSSV